LEPITDPKRRERERRSAFFFNRHGWKERGSTADPRMSKQGEKIEPGEKGMEYTGPTIEEGGREGKGT